MLLVFEAVRDRKEGWGEEESLLLQSACQRYSIILCYVSRRVVYHSCVIAVDNI